MQTLLLCFAAAAAPAAAAAAAPQPLVAPRSTSFAALLPLSPAPWPLPLPSRPAAAPAPTFVLTATCCGYGPYTPAAVASASAALGLFDEPCLPASWPILAEWGYELMNNQQHTFPTCGNLSFAAYPRPPATREEALARMALYWACRAADARGGAPAATPLVSEVGHYLLAAQSADDPANGFPVLPGAEVGENINSINLHLAATRGAARPHGAPWLIDFSSWFTGFLADFSQQRFWGPASSPTGGHSPSLHRRAMFAAFMAGAGCYVAEAGAVNYFLAAPPAPAGLALSPLGAIGAELYSFTHSNSSGSRSNSNLSGSSSSISGAPPPPTDPAAAVRGVPYTPLALATSPLTGLGLGFFYSSQSWDVFSLSPSEQRLAVALEALWPRSLTVERQVGTAQSEAGYMVQGLEAWDVTLLGAHTPASLAAAYRGVVWCGAGAVGEGEGGAALLAGYVAAGGAAVVCADDVAAAAAAGWLPQGFLGLQLAPAPSPPLLVSAATDLETGWVGTCSGSSGAAAAAAASVQQPFCVQSSGAGSPWYIKTGGNASRTAGWAPALGDRCCSVDAADCRWYSDAAACARALPAAPCRPCQCGAAAPSDVGCPAWDAASLSIALSPLYAANLTTATALLGFTPAASSSSPGAPLVLGAAVNAYGSSGGRVITLLAPGAAEGAALGVTAHLLARLANATLPFWVASNGTEGQGVQVLFNRLQSSWVLSIINNNGVVKAPNASAEVDWVGGGRRVTVGAGAGGGVGGAVASASARDGGVGAPWALAWDQASGTCQVDVPPGGLRIVEVVLEGGR
jgi:hypothetical protein